MRAASVLLPPTATRRSADAAGPVTAAASGPRVTPRTAGVQRLGARGRVRLASTHAQSGKWRRAPGPLGARRARLASVHARTGPWDHRGQAAAAAQLSPLRRDAAGLARNVRSGARRNAAPAGTSSPPEARVRRAESRRTAGALPAAEAAQAPGSSRGVLWQCVARRRDTAPALCIGV